MTVAIVWRWSLNTRTISEYSHVVVILDEQQTRAFPKNYVILTLVVEQQEILVLCNEDISHEFQEVDREAVDIDV